MRWNDITGRRNSLRKRLRGNVKRKLLKRLRSTLKASKLDFSAEIDEEGTDEDHVEAFLDDVVMLAEKYPDVFLDVEDDDGQAYLSSIAAKQRGAGSATKLMHDMCALLDKHQVTMELEPSPQDDDTRNEKLGRWYEQFGFRWISDERMDRIPQALTEAPIGNFDTSQIVPNGSFRPADQRIVKSEKGQAKMRRMFERLKQTVDVVFIDYGHPLDREQFSSHLQFSAGQKDYEDFAKRFNLPPRSSESAITLVLMNNEGANRVQMSAWIIAHRMAHALAYGPDCAEVLDNAGYAINDLEGYWRDGWLIPNIEVCYALGKMKSCRERNLTASGEWVAELFAQHVIQGSVTLNRLTRESADIMLSHANRHDGTPGPIRDSDIADFNELVGSVERQLTSDFNRMLKWAEGGTFVL